MSELITVTKIFILSLLILVLLQTKWNGMSFEKRAIISLHQSQIGQTIEDVAIGATKAIEKGTGWAKATFAKTAKAVGGSSAGSPQEQPTASR